MDATDIILLLIFGTIAAGVVVSIRSQRARSRDTELLRTALFAVTQRNYCIEDPVLITFDKSVSSALERFQRTAIDIQGMIELTARWMVLNMPPEVLKDMEVPEAWAEMENQQGLWRPRKEK